jgi:hypothetical protein
MIGQTTSTLGRPQNLLIDFHVGLFETQQPPTIWDTPSPSGTTPSPSPTKTSSSTRLESTLFLLIALCLVI